MPVKWGAHMSVAGGCENAILSAAKIGFDCVQLFSKNNNQWKAAALTDAHRKAFQDALIATGIVDPVVHTSYLINLASPDDTLWNKSIDAMTVEVERCDWLGIEDLVVHPGAHVGSGEDAGIDRVAKALDEVHRRTSQSRVIIDLETTAGQGTCLGHKFEHLGAILRAVKQPNRLGICVDSCHIFAAGYALGTPAEYHATIKELDEKAGLAHVRVWHLNDSLKELGSRVDRHAGIGMGCLGLEPFRQIVNDRRFEQIPMILETPKGIVDDEDLDAVNLRTLRSLESNSGTSD